MKKHHGDSSQPGTAGVMAAMGLAVIALAFASIFIVELQRAEVPPAVIAFYRMAIAAALLLPAAVAFKWREIAAMARGNFVILLVGGGCLALHFAAWITSLKYIPIATSVVLVNSHPLFIVVAAYLLGERPNTQSLIGAAIGFIGMIVISQGALVDFQVAVKGDALALLGAIAVVGYFIVGRKARARMSLLGYVAPLYAVCAVFLLLWAVAEGDSLAPFPRTVWVNFAALALVPTIIGHTVFNWAIKHVKPTAISLAFLGEPVAASILALAFFGQRPPLATFLGGALVLAGVYLATSK